MTDERLIAESWQCAADYRRKAARWRKFLLKHAVLGACNVAMTVFCVREGSAWAWAFCPLAAVNAAAVHGSLVLRREALHQEARS